MPQYLTPGVYIEEVPGAKPIEGVGTATGAFVGIAEKGSIGEAKLITNWTQFVENFGSFISCGYLANAVNQFFSEGGTRCYVARTCHYDFSTTPATKEAVTGEITLQDRAATPTIKVEALSEGSWSDNIWIEIADAKKDPNNKFKLVVWYKDVEVEAYEELTIADVEAKINSISKYIKVTNEASTTTPPGNRPARSGVDFNDGGQTVLRVTALDRGLTLTIADASDATLTGGFYITIFQAAAQVEDFDNLTMTDVERKINGVSKYIKVETINTTRPVNVPTGDLDFYALEKGWDGLEGTPLLDRLGTNTLMVSAFRDGETTIDIADAPSDPTNKFKLIVKFGGRQVEVFDDLTMAIVESEINGKSEYIEVNLFATNTTQAPDNRPATQTGTEVLLGLADMDFIGDGANKNGFHAFDLVDDINILAIPDRPGDREVAIAAYTYCQNRRDCFFVADAPMGLDPQGVLAFKEGDPAYDGGIYAGNAFNSSYGALYYPWIYVTDPLTGRNKLVPTSGAVAGTYSATDVLRGVHKAPAGTIDGYLNSAVGIERIVTKGEQELLNPEHINVIRSFPAAGIVIWGARTLSADPEWKYINVRRLLLYIEESIEEGTQWVVFEPNDRSIWARVKRDVSAFLTIVWRTGALFGATAEEAFFVKIDDENNPPEVRDAGQLIIDIGVAPVKPAEFVVFRITQKTQTAG